MFSKHIITLQRCYRDISWRCCAVRNKSMMSGGASDPDFMHKSMVRTDHFQSGLPTLKLPLLQETITRYLKSQNALLETDEYKATSDLAYDFIKTGQADNVKLWKKWKQCKREGTSYISGPWFEMYLKDRRAVALNHNPFMAFNDDPNPPYNDQLTRATNFVVSSMRFWKTYCNSVLEPEVFHLEPKKTDTETYRRTMSRLPGKAAYLVSALYYKAYPLDMSQFPRLMNSTRLPRFEKDELFTDTSSRDLLVLRNGHYYLVPVIDESGMVLSAAEIKAHLKYVLDDPSPPNEFPVGIMTSQDRDTWTGVRRKLVEAGNEQMLRALDSAAFALVLDDSASEDMVEISKSFLHGNDGSNRWFDKSFSLIINKNGKSCVNFEHAWGDGVAVLRYFNEVFKETTQKPHIHPDTEPAKVDSASAISKLEFNLTDEIKEDIRKAKENFANKTASLDLHAVKLESFGKNYLKEKNFGPDAFMQLAIQRAYFHLFGKTAATYESCSTAAFKHGRTETIRPCTMNTRLFNEAMANPNSMTVDLQKRMFMCADAHKQLTVEAAQGKGWDRHLFALKDLILKEGKPLPAFYQDPNYARMNHVILSTSTLSSPAVLIGGFCPVVPDGYGIGYATNNDALGAVVTTYPDRNGSDFVQAFETSVNELRDILDGGALRKK